MFQFAWLPNLWLLLLVPALIGLAWLSRRRRVRALSQWGDPSLTRRLTEGLSQRRRRWKFILILTAVSGCVLALARPQFGTRVEMVQREGQDIIVALDVSLSMEAQDIRPSRLEKAKREISDLIDQLKGDRIGLITFAGEAFVHCPLTVDYRAAKMFLASMSTDSVPLPGTALSEAIELAIDSFVKTEEANRVMILISDGEDHQPGAIDSAERARVEGVVIHTVGIGSREGVPIPVLDPKDQSRGFKKDSQGNVVLTRMDPAQLSQIADITQGRFSEATGRGGELEEIYQTVLEMDRKQMDALEITQFEERYSIFLILAVICLALEMSIPETKHTRSEWKGRFK